MAEVTVRVKINQTFTFIVGAENETEAIDAIVDLKEAHAKFLDACTENFTVEDAEYDAPEPDEDEDDDDDEEEDPEIVDARNDHGQE